MHAPNVKPEVSAGQDWRSTSLVTIESSADRGQVIDCGYGHMVYVPDDVVLPEAIELLFVTLGAAGPVVAHPRVLVVAGAGADQICDENRTATPPEQQGNIDA